MRVGCALVLVFLLAGCLAGCGRITPHARTVEEIRVMLEPGDYERLAYVTGEDCAGRYAIFFRFFSPNVVNAARDALKKAPGASSIRPLGSYQPPSLASGRN